MISIRKIIKEYIKKKKGIYLKLNTLPWWFGERRQQEIIRRSCHLIFCLILVFSCLFNSQLTNFINNIQFNIDTTISARSRVHFLNVNQADCIFIELPDGKNAFIDTGTKDSYIKIKHYLEKLNIYKNDEIDYLILTHTDSDHAGGMVNILNDFKVKNVFIPKINSTFDVENGKDVDGWKTIKSINWRNIKKSIYNENCNIYYNFYNTSITNKNYNLTFYSPLLDYYEDSNSYSPFIMVQIFNTKFMFTGDNSIYEEEDFLNYYSNLVSENFFDVDVLKVAHHGSKYSTRYEFIEAVNPEIAVISCGEENTYGHPTNEIINLLDDYNIKTFRTDLNGSVLVAVNENSFESKVNFENLTFNEFILQYYTVVFLLIILVLYCEYKVYDEEIVIKINLVYYVREHQDEFKDY